MLEKKGHSKCSTKQQKKQLTRDRTSHMELGTWNSQTWLQVEAGSAGACPARGIELQLSARTAAVSNVRTQRNVTVKIVSDWSRSWSWSRVRRVGMQSRRESLFWTRFNVKLPELRGGSALKVERNQKLITKWKLKWSRSSSNSRGGGTFVVSC